MHGIGHRRLLGETRLNHRPSDADETSVTDLTLPPHDDALAAQLAAREAASQQDAAVLAPLRSQAAARALGLPAPVPVPAPVDDQPLVIPDAAVPTPPAAAVPAPATPAASVAAASPGPWPMPVPEAADERARAFPPPGVVVPAGGPARVTTGVLAAAAAQRPRPERPVMELRPTVLATDIDRIGDQLVVMTDRLELRDRHGGLRRTLALADIDDVQVQRRLTSAVLQVSTHTATDLVIKGLRPEAAEAARETILRLRPADVPVHAQVDERALMRAIVELHRAGVLDDTELAQKTALVARMAGRSGRA
jgi:hypothetical protein